MTKILLLFSILVGFLIAVRPVYAQSEMPVSYTVGVVKKIVEETQITRENEAVYIQVVQVQNEQTGKLSTITVGSKEIPISKEQRYVEGQRVVLVTQDEGAGVSDTVIADQYRIPALVGLAVVFVAIVILVSWTKGLLSLIGMAASVGVLVFYMVPQILSGANPVLVSLVASTIISALIIYIGHGIHYRSHIALACMLVTLLVVSLGSSLLVKLSYLSGIGDETATYLQMPDIHPINLQGLLLGGIILAALSVLDDSVVSQVSVLYQLKSVKKDITFSELWKRGMEVGRDHISTLVNTLILAYAGASLPLFILLTVNASGQPTWYAINQQMIAEEIVRTLAGSIGLVLSIPLTTFIASYVIFKRSNT